jgi:hypothetical protein
MRNLFTRLSAAGVGLVDYLKGMVIALRIIIAAFVAGLGIGSLVIGPAALALVFPMRNLFTRLSAAGVGLVDYLKALIVALRMVIAAFLVGLGLGSILVGPAALALVIPQQFAPRYFQTQQTHYLRFAINATSCVYVANTCSFKVGSVPYNAFMVRAFTQTYTTFSGGGVTAFTAGFGTAVASANLMTATSVLTAGNAITQAIVAGGLGATVTGNGITSTGADGGFDVWVTVTATTGNPTAGAAIGIIEYIAPNDGSCVPVPLGSTSPGC